jgi:hypothetical protein
MPRLMLAAPLVAALAVAGGVAELWTRRLTRNGKEGIDMTPAVYDGTVLVSTIPGNTKSFYAGNGDGIAADGAKLWRNSKVNSGGGLWYPPAVDDQGRVFLTVANPAPFPGTAK